jgi:hypothetical protein
LQKQHFEKKTLSTPMLLQETFSFHPVILFACHRNASAKNAIIRALKKKKIYWVESLELVQ